MGRRKHGSIWSRRVSSFGVSAVLGAVCGAVCVLVFSLFVYMFMDDWRAAGVLSAAALAVSGYTAAFICGRYRRRHGLADGIICGVILYAVLAASGAAVLGHPTGLHKLFLLAAAGAVGGVVGVNSKRPKNLFD